MAFYREAIAEDFTGFEVVFDNHVAMDAVTENLIEQGRIEEAMYRIKNLFGYGMTDARRYCLKYQGYVLAKRDFEQGKTVYTEY